MPLLQPEQVPAESQACWTSWLGLQACNIDVPVEGERMVLQSPWWLDPNHAPPGAGYLSLLTWVYLDGEPGSSTHGMSKIDLRDATLRVAIRAQDLDLILDIPVALTVELGRTRIPIKQILQLAQGSVIELDALAGEPMDVLVNGCLIAQGEVVVVNEKFGIRLTDIVTPSERMRRVNK